MWNRTNNRPFGETVLKAMNPETQCEHNVNSIVVKNDFYCLLG